MHVTARKCTKTSDTREDFSLASLRLACFRLQGSRTAKSDKKNARELGREKGRQWIYNECSCPLPQIARVLISLGFFLFSRRPNYLRAWHRLREIFLRNLLRWWLCRLLVNLLRLLRLLLCTGVFLNIPYYAWSEMPVYRELKHAFLNDIVNT